MLLQEASHTRPFGGLGLRLSGWFLPSVPWRYRVGQHLAHRVPVQTEHPGGFPNAHPLHHAGPANPRVHLHCKHPSHLPKTDTQPYERQRTVRFSAAITQPVEPPTWSTLPPPFTHVSPLVKGQVGGDQDGAPLIALTEDLEAEFRAGGGPRHEAQLVDDEQLEAGQVEIHLQLLPSW